MVDLDLEQLVNSVILHLLAKHAEVDQLRVHREEVAILQM